MLVARTSHACDARATKAPASTTRGLSCQCEALTQHVHKPGLRPADGDLHPQLAPVMDVPAMIGGQMRRKSRQRCHTVCLPRHVCPVHVPPSQHPTHSPGHEQHGFVIPRHCSIPDDGPPAWPCPRSGPDAAAPAKRTAGTMARQCALPHSEQQPHCRLRADQVKFLVSPNDMSWHTACRHRGGRGCCGPFCCQSATPFMARRPQS